MSGSWKSRTTHLMPHQHVWVNKESMHVQANVLCCRSRVTSRATVTVSVRVPGSFHCTENADSWEAAPLQGDQDFLVKDSRRASNFSRAMLIRAGNKSGLALSSYSDLLFVTNSYTCGLYLSLHVLHTCTKAQQGLTQGLRCFLPHECSHVGCSCHQKRALGLESRELGGHT